MPDYLVNFDFFYYGDHIDTDFFIKHYHDVDNQLGPMKQCDVVRLLENTLIDLEGRNTIQPLIKEIAQKGNNSAAPAWLKKQLEEKFITIDLVEPADFEEGKRAVAAVRGEVEADDEPAARRGTADAEVDDERAARRGTADVEADDEPAEYTTPPRSPQQIQSNETDWDMLAKWFDVSHLRTDRRPNGAMWLSSPNSHESCKNETVRAKKHSRKAPNFMDGPFTYENLRGYIFGIDARFKDVIAAAKRRGLNLDIGYHTTSKHDWAAGADHERLYSKMTREDRCKRRIHPQLTYFVRMADAESMRRAETYYLTWAENANGPGKLYNRRGKNGKFGGTGNICADPTTFALYLCVWDSCKLGCQENCCLQCDGG